MLMQIELKTADTFVVAMKEFEEEIAGMPMEEKEHIGAYMQNILSIIYDHDLHMYGGDTLDHKVGPLFAFLEVGRSLEPLDHSLPTPPLAQKWLTRFRRILPCPVPHVDHHGHLEREPDSTDGEVRTWSASGRSTPPVVGHVEGGGSSSAMASPEQQARLNQWRENWDLYDGMGRAQRPHKRLRVQAVCGSHGQVADFEVRWIAGAEPVCRWTFKWLEVGRTHKLVPLLERRCGKGGLKRFEDLGQQWLERFRSQHHDGLGQRGEVVHIDTPPDGQPEGEENVLMRKMLDKAVNWDQVCNLMSAVRRLPLSMQRRVAAKLVEMTEKSLLGHLRDTATSRALLRQIQEVVGHVVLKSEENAMAQDVTAGLLSRHFPQAPSGNV